ncbi:hypothetical protein [Kocuria sp. HSID16901]|uniref:hypothetical protein n=1 Tax=Kocuria sp. HSID16901 TaxID=2419505 RepID=UPI00065F9FEF|nr:hypothetical protein [Kocuria sp. HSID16901]RUQ20256.1 hypothetical protein D8M21_09785 [Kocuria sp. HSID16901]
MTTLNKPSPESSGISRRTVALGAAWSLPLMTAAASVPAQAASSHCNPIVIYDGDIRYHWGDVGNYGTTTQVLRTSGGNVTIVNLPHDVTVEMVVIDNYIQRRASEYSPGPGALEPDHRLATFSGEHAGTRPGNSWEARQNNTTNNSYEFDVTAMYPTRASGFDPYVVLSNPRDGVPVRFSDGNVTRAWKMRYTWNAWRNRLPVYSPGQGGCKNFSTGWSGHFNVTYRDLPRTYRYQGSAPLARAEITATLSNGQKVYGSVSS